MENVIVLFHVDIILKKKRFKFSFYISATVVNEGFATFEILYKLSGLVVRTTA